MGDKGGKLLGNRISSEMVSFVKPRAKDII